MAILCAGYKGDRIAEYYRQHDMGLETIVSIEPRPLGTGGAIQYAKAWIGSEPFLVLNGDVISDVNIADLVSSFQRGGFPHVVTLFYVSDARSFGLVKHKDGERKGVGAPGAKGLGPPQNLMAPACAADIIYDLIRPVTQSKPYFFNAVAQKMLRLVFQNRFPRNGNKYFGNILGGIRQARGFAACQNNSLHCLYCKQINLLKQSFSVLSCKEVLRS